MDDIKKLKSELDKSLGTGSYTNLFFEDIFYLWQQQLISPEVIFREIRVMEGLEKPLMEVEGDSPIPIWTGNYEIEYNKSSSATKEATQFRKLPLKNLWHKHYFINQQEFLKPNIDNLKNKYPGLHPNMAMTMRILQGKVTGEWLIYKKQDDIYTYLCLAKHTDDDNVIYQRMIDSGITL